MKDATHYRAMASACRRLADERLEWCDNPHVIKRYQGVPESLEARRKLGMEVMEAATDFDEIAAIYEAA